MSTLQRDQVVGQRYQLVELLGEGGMGEVWSALHVVTRKPVAIKFLKSHEKASVNEQLSQRFIREARAASAIHHPNVVEVHDVLTHDDGLPMMVMDLLRGRTLSAVLEGGPLSTLDAATILLPIVSAVRAAHGLGIIHRDLKPDNLFLAQLGDGRIEPKVLDFGIAKITQDDNQAAGLTATGSMLGTPYYMSPEQMFGEKNVDGRSDIWSLGVIVYECLAGARPFDGENFGQLMKAISSRLMTPLGRLAPATPAEVLAMVDRMLTVDRTQRPSIDELHSFLHGYSQSRESSRISVRNLPPAVVQMADRTSVLTPRPVTGPHTVQMPPNQALPNHHVAMHQTGPRTPTPMSNSQFGGRPSLPIPGTLSGAATSQTGGAIGRSEATLPLYALLGIAAVLIVMAGGGLALIIRASKVRDLAHAADAQPSATLPVATATATATVTATSVPTPTVTMPPPPPPPPPADSVATRPPAVDAGVKPSVVGQHVSPAPATKPNGTTVPGGVATTVPF